MTDGTPHKFERRWIADGNKGNEERGLGNGDQLLVGRGDLRVSPMFADEKDFGFFPIQAIPAMGGIPGLFCRNFFVRFVFFRAIWRFDFSDGKLARGARARRPGSGGGGIAQPSVEIRADNKHGPSAFHMGKSFLEPRGESADGDLCLPGRLLATERFQHKNGRAAA
jgi:hypothetical protein